MNTSIQPTNINNGLPSGSIIPGEQAKVNPVQAGSIVGLPVGSIVHVNVNGSLVPVKTVPAPMASTTMQTQTVPLPSPPVATYQTQSVQVPQYIPTGSVNVTGSVQGNPTPTIKTLPPRIVKNELPAKYNTVTLPPKIVTTRLSPILPPPTPQLSIPSPPVQSLTVPQTVQTSIPLPSPQSVTLPTSTSVYNPNIQSISLPLQPVVNTSVQGLNTQVQPATTQYASTSFNPVTTQYGTTSVEQINPYASNQSVGGTQPLPTLNSLI